MNQQPGSDQNQGGTRPMGITIIAALLAIGAVFGIIGGLGQIIGGPFAIFGNAGVGGFISKEFDGTIGLILAAAQFLVAYGLFTLKPWSFWVTVGVELLGVLHGCFGFAGRANAGICAGLLPIIILAYMFLDGNVRRAFRT